MNGSFVDLRSTKEPFMDDVSRRAGDATGFRAAVETLAWRHRIDAIPVEEFANSIIY